MLNRVDIEQIISFRTRTELHRWIAAHHRTSAGIWVRLYRKGSDVPSITFEDLLEEGLCFGWSESQRKRYDGVSYLQKFTPRKKKGTVSPRNKRLVQRLEKEGKMTDAGRAVLK